MSNLDPESNRIEGKTSFTQKAHKKTSSKTQEHTFTVKEHEKKISFTTDTRIETVQKNVSKSETKEPSPLPTLSPFHKFPSWKKVLDIWKQEHPELQGEIEETFTEEKIETLASKIPRIPIKSQLFFENKEIKHIVLSELGSGNFKKVDKAFHLQRQSFEAFATSVQEHEGVNEIEKEYSISELLRSLDVPNIIIYHELTSQDGKTGALMELCDQGDLLEFMEQETEVQNLYTILYQAALSFAKMHEVGFVHRDIKPDNLFVKSGLQVRVGDLGLVVPHNREDEPAGTLEYMAPELVLGYPTDFGEKQDAWSFGALLYYAAAGAPLIDDDLSTQIRAGDIEPQEFFEQVKKNVENLDWKSKIKDEKMRETIQGLLDTNPETRWTIERALPALKSLAAIPNEA